MIGIEQPIAGIDGVVVIQMDLHFLGIVINKIKMVAIEARSFETILQLLD